MSLQPGDQAPDFTLRDQHGRSVALGSLRGHKAVVVMFYPYAFSPVCTGELAAVRDSAGAFQSDHVQVLAISCDSVFTLRAFAEAEHLGFPLLSDFWPHGAVATAYDVFDADRGRAERSTFIADKAGVIRWSVHNPTQEPRDLEQQAEVLADVVRDDE